MVPKSRMDQVLEENKRLKDEQTAREDRERKETERRAKEQGQYKELVEQKDAELTTLKPQLQAKQERLTALEATMAAQITERVKALPAEAQKVFSRLGDDVLVQFAALPEVEALAAQLSIARSPGTPPGPRGTGAQPLPAPVTLPPGEGLRI